jgi:LmbE family N-acetylglucosaminyl deacetylase
MRGGPFSSKMSGLVVVTLVFGAMLGCGSSERAVRVERTSGTRRWAIIAPHPDDEALIASGVIHRAVRSGEHPAVIVMTNGDLDCVHDGIRREGETIAGLRALGLPEERVFFLGYPDGGLALLGRAPLPPRRRIIEGVCTAGQATYGSRGFGRRDYHTVRFGVPAASTRENAVADLVALLGELHPTDVATTHPEDTHPDHAATYSLLRSALDRLAFAPRVHRAMVHNGDCWPTGPEPGEPCPPARIAPYEPNPGLSGRLAGYAPGERLAVPADCLVPDPMRNPKLRAIGAHTSQTGGSPTSYLFAFARADEAFFPESFTKTGRRWRRISNPPPAEMVDTTLRMGPDERRIVALGPPLSVSINLARPTPTERGSVARLGLLEDRSGSYSLALDADRRRATLVRTVEAGPPNLTREWLLPHDLWASGNVERFSLAIERRPEDGGVAELTLYCRDEIVGVAVDVRPRSRGAEISVLNAKTADGVLEVHGAPNLSASPNARPSP